VESWVEPRLDGVGRLPFRVVASNEKRLLRTIHRFVPTGVRVVAAEEAIANPIDDQRRATPVALTDQGLLLVTATGATGIVTHVPFQQITRARSEGNVLIVCFTDEADRPRAFSADFRRGGPEFIGKFFAGLREIQPDLDREDGRVPARSFHVAWDRGRGATLDVFEGEGRDRIRARYDGEFGGIEASELCKQATTELARAIARNPELVWVRPHAEWMPEFVWTPPLPHSPQK
jgi:hypothetical protein